MNTLMDTLPLELQMDIYRLACMGELTDKIKEVRGKQCYKKEKFGSFIHLSCNIDEKPFSYDEPSKFQSLEHEDMYWEIMWSL